MSDEYDSWRRYEDAKAFKNKLAEIDQLKDRIEKLEAALRMVIDWDNTLDWEEAWAWGDIMDNVSKALEGKDE